MLPRLSTGMSYDSAVNFRHFELLSHSSALFAYDAPLLPIVTKALPRWRICKYLLQSHLLRLQVSLLACQSILNATCTSYDSGWFSIFLDTQVRPRQIVILSVIEAPNFVGNRSFVRESMTFCCHMILSPYNSAIKSFTFLLSFLIAIFSKYLPRTVFCQRNQIG